VVLPALIGHIVLMVLALAAAHALGVAARPPPRTRAATPWRSSPSSSLLLVVGGILAIGRSIV